MNPLRRAPALAARLLAIATCLLMPATFAQKEGVPPAQAPPVMPPTPGYAYPQHETLTFTVDWRVFTAGKAVFQLDQAPGVMKVQASADTVGAIMEMMTTGKFRHLPVVEGDKVVGLISIGDIVKWRVKEFENEQEALQNYIKTA